MVTKGDFFNDLLKNYRELWNNRVLYSTIEDSEFILRDAIKKDIMDELTHPRVRKDKMTKFYWAVRRINDSSIDPQIKLELIHVYIEELDKLSKDN